MAEYVDRLSAKSLIPPEIAREIIQGGIKHSVAMQIFRRIRNMTRDELIMPALSMLPVGGWLNSDNAIKPLTQQAWEKVEMMAEEYAARMIIPDNVREDAEYDMWAEIRPRLEEAYGRAFDAAVFMGIDKPRRFGADIVTGCIHAGAVVTPTTNIMSDINEAMKLVEKSGYNPTAIVAGVEMKSVFRMNVDSTGQPITGSFIDSLNKYYLDNGAWDSTRAMMIVGDFSQAVYSVREDMQMKISADAATNMSDGLHSMFDEDSQVLRVKFRIGYAIPNPVNVLQPDPMVRFPFAIIAANPEVTTYTVTFILTDSTSSPIENAVVKMGGMTSKTDSNGQAIFKSQANQVYSYVAKVDNKVVKKGTISVETSDVTIDIVA